jgi:signal transduction histidine kinase
MTASASKSDLSEGRTKAPNNWRQSLPCYLSVLDRQLRIIEVNHRFLKDFGEQTGEFCYTAYKNTDEPCPDCPVLQTFHDNGFHSSEELVTTLDGQQKHVVVSSTPLLNDQGEIIAAIEMATDITEIKTLRNELTRTRRDYKTLFESVPCYICVLDRDFRIIESNNLYKNTFNGEPGLHCYEACKGSTKKCDECLVEKTFKTGEEHTSEESITLRDGRKINLIANAMPIVKNSGEVKSVMEVFTDITEVKNLQHQLVQMGRAVAGMAHRIKNIMMGLEGGIFVVNTGMELNEQDTIEQGWKMVENNVGRVSKLVMDLLFCSKKRKPEFNSGVSPHDIAREVEALYKNRLFEDGIEFAIELSEPPHQGVFDSEALNNLLSNLVANALDACRFDTSSGKGSHKITLRCYQDDTGATVFEIEDNGAGIPEDMRKKVFEDFFSTKGTEGTGVGLLVVQRVAEEHGGKISFTSELGLGTIFKVVIPPIVST